MTTLKFDYRQAAKDAVKRAREELRSGDPSRYRYAALELRDAIEALTYERAQRLSDEIHPSEYKTWQPTKLLKVILEIDPNFGKKVTLSVGREDVPGEQAKVMRVMGTETPISKPDIKSNYDSLGSYLHMPTWNQIEAQGSHNFDRLKAKCEDVASVLESVLASRVYNIDFARRVKFECFKPNCKATVRKSFRDEHLPTKVVCFDCNADYIISEAANGTFSVEPNMEGVPCGGCGKDLEMWPTEIKPGTWWTCSCGKKNTIVLGVSSADP